MADQQHSRRKEPTEVESTPLLLKDGTAGSSRESPAVEETATTAKVMNLTETESDRRGESEERDGSAEAVVKADGDGTPKLDDFYRMGRYMMVVCVLAQLLLLVEVGDLLFMTFAGAAPKVRKCGNYIFPENMKPEERCAKISEWDTAGGGIYNCTLRSVEKNDLEYQFHSVNVDFDQLYCETDSVKKMISVQVTGIIPGSIVFGWFSDTFGRRPVMLACLLSWICSMIGTTFTSSLLLFTIARFIVCFFNAGIAVTLIVFTSELYPKELRFILMNLITWAPNYILFGVIAYFFEEWRLLQRVLAMMALPCIALIWFLDESPRFLISARKITEAKKAIMRMYKFDGRHCDEQRLDEVLERERRQMEELAQTKQKYNYWHLFYSAEFTLYTISVAFSLFVVTFITYGLLYNMEKLSGSLYVNMMLMGAFKYSMNLTISAADRQFKWLGRKMAHLISETLVIVALSLYVICYFFDVNIPYLGTALIVGTVGFCGVLFNADKLAGSELFPTGVRNLSCSFGQVCSRIGVVCAPLIFFLKNVCDSKFCFVLPYLTLIAISVLDVIFFHIVVRETKGHPLISEFPVKTQKRANGENKI